MTSEDSTPKRQHAKKDKSSLLPVIQSNNKIPQLQPAALDAAAEAMVRGNLFDFDRGTRIGQFGLDLFGFVLRDAFLQSLRRSVH